MPPTPLHYAPSYLQQRLTIIPKDGQKPTWWLFVIISASVVGLTALSGLIGCIACACSQRRHDPKVIDKKVTKYLERAQRRGHNSKVNDKKLTKYLERAQRRHPTSTLSGQDEEDEVVERRTSKLFSPNAFVGREQKLNANNQKVKLNRNWKRSSIAMPVTIGDLERRGYHFRSSQGRGTSRSTRSMTVDTTAAQPTSEPDHVPEMSLHVPSSQRHNQDTSTDYEEPATLMQQIRSTDMSTSKA